METLTKFIDVKDSIGLWMYTHYYLQDKYMYTLYNFRYYADINKDTHRPLDCDGGC